MDFKNNALVLVTRGRADVKKQFTLKALPSLITKNIIVVTSPDEVDQLNNVLNELGIKVKGVVGISHTSIGEARQTIIDKLKSNVIFMDDNLSFHAREYSDKGIESKYLLKGIIDKNFTEQTKVELFKEMFTWFTDQLNTNKYGIVGLSNRASNNFIKYGQTYNDRIYAFWGISYKNYVKIGKPSISEMSTLEDFALQLSFLTNGVPNVKTSTFAFDKKGGANTDGGCSRYRTSKKMEENSELLRSMFPQSVSIVEKDSSKWSNFDTPTFKDVKIKWKASYTGSVDLELIDPRTKENYKNKFNKPLTFY